MDHIEAGQLLRKWNGQPKEVTVPDSTMQTGTQSSFHAILNDIKEAPMQATQSPFDINALFSAAILNAVNAATAPLLERIELLERSLVVADKAAQGNEADLFSRVEDLETIVRDRLFGEQPDKYKTSDIDEMSSRLSLLEDRFDNITTASDERIKEIAEEVAEAAIYEHNDEYDHDEYDRLFNDLGDKVNDAVNDAVEEIDFEDKVREVLRGASVSIDI